MGLNWLQFIVESEGLELCLFIEVDRFYLPSERISRLRAAYRGVIVIAVVLMGCFIFLFYFQVCYSQVDWGSYGCLRLLI